MADTPIRIGLVGLGAHMYENLLQRLLMLPADITAVCDIRADRAELFARSLRIGNAYADYREMLERESLDAVICAANAEVHYEVAKLGMRSGRYVFVEKAPCATREQAEELLDVQNRTGCYTAVGFNRRFASSYVMAKEIALRPEFAPVSMYQAKYHAAPYGSQASFVFNHIVNHLDLARFLLGEIDIRHVDHVRQDERRGAYNINFVSAGGTLGNIQAASVLDMTYPMERVELTGGGRNVIVDNLKSIEYNRPGTMSGGYDNPVLASGGDALRWNVNHGLHTNFTYLGYDLELSSFVEAVRSRRMPQVHMEDSLKTMRLLEQLQSYLAQVK